MQIYGVQAKSLQLVEHFLFCQNIKKNTKLIVQCVRSDCAYTYEYVLPVRVSGSPDFKGFFVTARNSEGATVGTMSTANSGHRLMCSDQVLSSENIDFIIMQVSIRIYANLHA